MIEVMTDEYRASHKKAPRGRGMWAFAVGVYGGKWLSECFWFNGSYADAKKAAVRFARNNASDIVSVQP
jgi:hypothetical protein